MTYAEICKLIGYLYDAEPEPDRLESDDERELLRRIEHALFLAHEIQREKRPKPLDCT